MIQKYQNRREALRGGRGNAGRYTSIARNEEQETATVYLYDVIGDVFFGTDAQQLVRELNELDVSRINVRINSPGGSVFDARAIVTALNAHPAKVHTFVDGMALSAASWIATSGDHRVQAQGAFMMIHESWSIVVGNKNELRKEADLMEKIDDSIVDTLSATSDLSPDQVRDMMREETWFDAAESLKFGLVDEVVDLKDDVTESDDADDASNLVKVYDLSVFKHPPQIDPQEPIDDAVTNASRERAKRRLRALERLNP